MAVMERDGGGGWISGQTWRPHAACMAGNTPAAAAGIAPLLNKATCAFDRRAQSFPSSKLGRRPSIKHHACIVRVKGASPLFMNLVVGRGAKLCESPTPLGVVRPFGHHDLIINKCFFVPTLIVRPDSRGRLWNWLVVPGGAF